MSNTSEYAEWYRTSRSGPTRVLDFEHVDTLLDANAVGRTLLIKFGVFDKKTKKKSFEWYECIVVYSDADSIGIVGADREPYWWDRESLESDLVEGLFKEWI